MDINIMMQQRDESIQFNVHDTRLSSVFIEELYVAAAASRTYKLCQCKKLVKSYQQ